MVTLKLYCDGGSRGNPGPSGVGVAGYEVESSPGEGDRVKCIFETALFLESKSNNFAEYTALITALDYAIRSNYTEVIVHSDSKLIIEQITGTWRVKSPDLLPLYVTTSGKLRQLKGNGVNVQLKWIPREMNRHADSLANLAMDREMAPSINAPEAFQGKVIRVNDGLIALEEAIERLPYDGSVCNYVRHTFDILLDAWTDLKI